MQGHFARATDGAALSACAHGAQLLSWQTPDGRERLFLSPLSQPAPGVAIRGGVPVCFPQFSGFGPLPKHGFVRDRVWQCTAAGTAADGRARLTYALEADAATRALWPQAFRCELELLAAGDTLAATLAVHNTGDEPLSFTGALHTYFAVTDLAAARERWLRIAKAHDEVTAERLQNLFAVPFMIQQQSVRLSATMGLVRLDEHDTRGADLLKDAHLALKRAKGQRRGTACYFSPEMGQEARARMQLLDSLRTATGSSQLFVMRGRFPHLDGMYPWVGRASGPWEEVVEGDTIRKATVVGR